MNFLVPCVVPWPWVSPPILFSWPLSWPPGEPWKRTWPGLMLPCLSWKNSSVGYSVNLAGACKVLWEQAGTVQVPSMPGMFTAVLLPIRRRGLRSGLRPGVTAKKIGKEGQGSNTLSNVMKCGSGYIWWRRVVHRTSEERRSVSWSLTWRLRAEGLFQKVSALPSRTGIPSAP